MRSAISFLAMLVLVSSLIAGCGCLAADSYYAKPAECEKYHTDWPRQHNDRASHKPGKRRTAIDGPTRAVRTA